AARGGRPDVAAGVALLVRVGRTGAVVAHVADPVAIAVGLVRVRDVRAIVERVVDSVVVRVIGLLVGLSDVGVVDQDAAAAAAAAATAVVVGRAARAARAFAGLGLRERGPCREAY